MTHWNKLEKFWPLPFTHSRALHYIHSIYKNQNINVGEKKLLNPSSFQELKTIALRVVGLLFFLSFISQNLLTAFHALFVPYKWYWCLGWDLIQFLHSFRPFVLVYCCCFFTRMKPIFVLAFAVLAASNTFGFYVVSFLLFFQQIEQWFPWWLIVALFYCVLLAKSRTWQWLWMWRRHCQYSSWPIACCRSATTTTKRRRWYTI